MAEQTTQTTTDGTDPNTVTPMTTGGNQTQPDPAKKGNGPDPVPYDRFKAVNDENKTLKDQLAALQAKEEAGKTDLEKLTERLTALEGDLTKERQQNLKMQVAQEKGIPPNLVNRLQGSTREELEADAATLAGYLKAPESPGVRTIPRGGQATTFDLAGKSPEEIRKAMSEGKIKF